MIGCLFGLLAFFTPRVAIVLLWVFNRDWLYSCFAKMTPPFNECAIPVLGLILAPYTLLAYCLTIHANGGVVSGLWIVLIVLAALMDLGVIGHGNRSRRKWGRRGGD